jgi:hypothetical protein
MPDVLTLVDRHDDVGSARFPPVGKVLWSVFYVAGQILYFEAHLGGDYKLRAALDRGLR